MSENVPASAVAEATTGRGAFRDELRSLVSGANLGVLLLAVAAGIWGAIDSMTDAGEERFWGNLPVIAPSVYAAWCMIQPALRRSTNAAAVILRLVSACFIAPGLVAVPIGAILAIAVLFPGVREAITSAQADNGGFHYYWSEGIAAQLLLIPMSGWMVGMAVALGVGLIVTLPIVSLRAPSAVISGSHIEKVDAHQRDSSAALVFCGLGATMLGIVLWTFGDGGSLADVPADLGRFAERLSYGVVIWEESGWLLGVVFVTVGVLAMSWGCVRVLTARHREATR